MQKRHGKIRVEGVTFTQQSKEVLATGLYSAFTEEYVRIPKTDAGLPGLAPGSAVALRDDICAIRRIITAAGNIRYAAPHTDDGHADRAWSLALALHACAAAPGSKFVASGR
jgi:phage FluMu gp28-like protein